MTEISIEEAKVYYCKGLPVYVSNIQRTFWKLPASWEYSSHAPAEELFNRSIPKFEGENKFYI